MYFSNKKSVLINIDAQLLGKAQARRIDIARVLEDALATKLRTAAMNIQHSPRGSASKPKNWPYPKREYASPYHHRMKTAAESILQTGI